MVLQQIILILVLLFVIFMIVSRADFNIGIFGSIFRGHPKMQDRSYPYGNGRMVGGKRGREPLEHGWMLFRYKLGRFKKPIEKKVPKGYYREEHDTRHPEGMWIIDEFQPEGQIKDTATKLLLDLVNKTETQLHLAEDRLAILVKAAESDANPKLFLTLAKDVAHQQNLIRQELEQTKKESAMIIEGKLAEDKKLERPKPPETPPSPTA